MRKEKRKTLYFLHCMVSNIEVVRMKIPFFFFFNLKDESAFLPQEWFVLARVELTFERGESWLLAGGQSS